MSTNRMAGRVLQHGCAEDELWRAIDRLLADERGELEVRITGLFLLFCARSSVAPSA